MMQDASIRVWGWTASVDQPSLQQKFEFRSPNDTPTAVALVPSSDTFQVVCGFESGVVRVFDVHSTSLGK